MIIRTDKPFYFAGEVVTGINFYDIHLGNIYLNVFREGFPGRVISLKVTGKEKCYWTEARTEQVRQSNGTTTSRTYYVTHDGKK